MESREERIAVLEARVERLEKELKNVGKATPLTIPLKTLVYAEGAAILLLICTVAYMIPLVIK